jgi:uncharacterized membrane protein
VRRLRGELSVWNERVKLVGAFLNAIAIGLVGFALLRPLTEDVALVSLSSLGWSSVGLAMHVLAHYGLGMIQKEVTDEQ